VGQITTVSTQNQSNSKVGIYPNPSTGSFTIQNSANKKILIYDIQGKLILEKTIQTESETITLENSHNGVGEGKPIPFFLQ